MAGTNNTPLTDQLHAAARDNVLGYVGLMRSLLESGKTRDEAVGLLGRVLTDMDTSGDRAIGMFLVALVELAQPGPDLSAFEE